MSFVLNAKIPLIVRSEKGEDIARLNPDLTWSVRWSDVLDQAYADPHECNTILRGCCTILLAARDNFITSKWDDPIQEWSGQGVLLERNTPYEVFTLSEGDVPFAGIYENGMWYIDWNCIEAVHALDSSQTCLQMSGMCGLLLAARDRFLAQRFVRV